MKRAILTCTVVALALAGLGTGASSALAAAQLEVTSTSNTHPTPADSGPGSAETAELTYYVEVLNFGTSQASGDTRLEARLPEGLSAIEASGGGWSCQGANPGDPVLGARTLECRFSTVLESKFFQAFGAGASYAKLAITVSVDPGVPYGAALNSLFDAFDADAVQANGSPCAPAPPGTPCASTADSTTIDSGEPQFGIDGFDLQAQDAAGNATTAAASHPFAVFNALGLNAANNHNPALGSIFPVAPFKDILTDLPPGLVGSPGTIPQCTAVELLNGSGSNGTLCPPASQVGVITISVLANPGEPVGSYGPFPVFNMPPPPGVPARFGFVIASTVVALDAEVRSDSDYGVTVGAKNIPEALAVLSQRITFWGTPSDPSHDRLRGCPGKPLPNIGGPTCPGGDETAFLRMPTSCTEPGEGWKSTVHTDSWSEPGVFKEQTIESHEPPGFPYDQSEWGAPVGTEDCAEVPFEPHITVRPTTSVADSPTGLDVDLSMPQEALADPNAIAQADVKDSIVTQPVGTRVNPAAATGLTGCSEKDIGFIGGGFPMPNPTHFTPNPPTCPDSSKIGTVEIESPLIPDKLEGSIYQARQDENPFGSTLAFYTVAEADGVLIKLPAEVRTDPKTGQVTTVFRDNPQLPFEHYKLHFFGGPHAPLITPPTCGTKVTRSTFTGWANPQDPVQLKDSFKITSQPGGAPCVSSEADRPFAPRFEAGTVNPLAGSFSPFVLKVSREDGTQELSKIDTTLPPGLLGKLAGVPYCPEAAIAAAMTARGLVEQAAPNCPAASQVGVSDATVGAGPDPFHNPGKVYLAGPYEGAPLSLAIVTPAVAGPLDIGTVVVRAALHVDPETAQINAVSDPIPSVLTEGGDGFPLDLRQVTVQINHPSFTLNPTSCEPMAVAGRLASTLGATASLSSRFQVGGCERLPFKPHTKLFLRGATGRRGHPSLRVLVTAGFSNEANVARAITSLPPSELLDQSHIGTVCTRVQYAAGAGGGAECPAASIYGHVFVSTPLLEQPLSGNVYLRSSSHSLPDLVMSLNGQIHVDLPARIDTTKKDGLRATLENVPDAFVAKFELTLPGGKKGLLQNSQDLCNGTHRAFVYFEAHNGKVEDSNPPLRAKCAAHRKRGGGHRHRHMGGPR